MAAVVSMPRASFAWGKKGHEMVAEIAWSFLDNNTKAAVQKYLGATTIQEAGTWMDDVRGDHSYDYMKTWHYVNIEKGKEYTKTTDDNLVNALNKAITELEHRGNKSNDDIKKDLMIVFHLVGDMHMPLHVGYEEDKGGNTIHVTYLGHRSNLHRVWDSEIIESEKITTNDCLAELKNISKNEMDGLRKVNVENWVHEPRTQLNNVYAFNDEAIDQAYIDKNKNVVERQLLIAGIRLSSVLEQIFKS